MRKERRHGGSEGKRGGRKRVEEGGSNMARERAAREERGRNGDKEGWKLQGRYHKEDTGQYTVYSRERTKQHTTRPLPLRLWYYGYINSVL